MRLFSFIKRQENEAAEKQTRTAQEVRPAKVLSGDVSDSSLSKKIDEQKKQGARIKILGSGCARCKDFEKAVRAAILELGLNMGIEQISDFSRIASYGVMLTPALVLDGKVVSYGKVLSTDEIVKILSAL